MNTRAYLRILFTFCSCVLLLIGAAYFLMHARWTPEGLYTALPADLDRQRPSFTVYARR